MYGEFHTWIGWQQIKNMDNAQKIEEQIPICAVWCSSCGVTAISMTTRTRTNLGSLSRTIYISNVRQGSTTRRSNLTTHSVAVFSKDRRALVLYLTSRTVIKDWDSFIQLWSASGGVSGKTFCKMRETRLSSTTHAVRPRCCAAVGTDACWIVHGISFTSRS